MPGPDVLTDQPLSHCRILERTDGGGTGVAYQARDNALTRPVGLEFLPDDLAR